MPIACRSDRPPFFKAALMATMAARPNGVLMRGWAAVRRYAAIAGRGGCQPDMVPSVD